MHYFEANLKQVESVRLTWLSSTLTILGSSYILSNP
jgi:hypothetical protein